MIRILIVRLAVSHAWRHRQGLSVERFFGHSLPRSRGPSSRKTNTRSLRTLITGTPAIPDGIYIRKHVHIFMRPSFLCRRELLLPT
jgi:hypothetical protein